jgi:hypothetical protein
MKTYNLTLTESQLSSLKTFLERTELKGREAHLFFGLVQAINECEKAAETNISINADQLDQKNSDKGIKN